MPAQRRMTTWGVFAIAFLTIISAEHSARATLIVTAICKDGVYVRSDRRNTIKHPSKPVEYRDVLNKLFVTKDKKIIIYNHGINVINRTSWRKHAATLAAKLQESATANIESALKLFETTLARDMAAEFARNKFDGFCAFVVIIKIPDGRYRAGEISWRKNRRVKKMRLGRFIRSGSGNRYFHPQVRQKDNKHWASLTVKQARSEIAELFDSCKRRLNTVALGRAKNVALEVEN